MAEPEHGTTAAAQRHYTNGEKPCEPCRQALAAYQREKYHNDAEGRAVKQALHRARQRALTRLARDHEAEYLGHLADEMTAENLDAGRVRERAWQAAFAITEGS